MTEQNSAHPRCVDGRKGEIFVEMDKKTEEWKVVKRGAEAAVENGPQFLGASLMFVAALMKLQNMSLEEAMDLAEQASGEAGLGMQIHIDNHHGEYDIENMSDDEIIKMIMNYDGGCGFSVYAEDIWGVPGAQVIRKAIERGWRIQILGGEHAETGAQKNKRAGETFDTATAVVVEKSKFNIDEVEARIVFDKLEELIAVSGFADEAMAWMDTTYDDVVVALKGAKDPSEIEVVEAAA